MYMDRIRTSRAASFQLNMTEFKNYMNIFIKTLLKSLFFFFEKDVVRACVRDIMPKRVPKGVIQGVIKGVIKGSSRESLRESSWESSRES